jgi:hypothetical protein
MKAMIFDGQGMSTFRLHLGLSPVGHEVIISAFFKAAFAAGGGFSQAHDFGLLAVDTYTIQQ